MEFSAQNICGKSVWYSFGSAVRFVKPGEGKYKVRFPRSSKSDQKVSSYVTVNQECILVQENFCKVAKKWVYIKEKSSQYVVIINGGPKFLHKI